jgi:transposase
MRVEICSVGVDVSKDRVEISEGGGVARMANKRQELEKYFSGLSVPARVAVESTSRYHVGVVEAAMACGHTVYLVDGFRLSRYRDAIGLRAKTDVTDAQLLSRYVAAEGERLVPYRAPPKAVQELRELLRARAQLKKNQVAVRLSLEGVEDGDLASSHAALDRQFGESIALIDRKLKRCLQESGYASDAARCLAIPGVGALNAAALVAAFHRGVFRSGDAFIAFLGLDVRVRESGRYSGRRKLSKRGDPELRRLLFNAARAGARTSTWRGYYEHLRTRGLSTTAACVVLARKIARVAFALLRNQTEYRPPGHVRQLT